MFLSPVGLYVVIKQTGEQRCLVMLYTDFETMDSLRRQIPSLKEMPIKKESDFDLSYRETDQYKKQQEIYKMVYSMNDDYSRTFSMPEDITEYL